MATFAKSTFSASSYAAARPMYPSTLYQKVLRYHQGAANLCVDLGSGHGIVCHALSKHFTRVIGTDPSDVMIAKAKESTSSAEYPNIEYRTASAESLHFISDLSVDLVTAGQAAHWFGYPQAWQELKRVLRQGGTIAFWGYKDPVFLGWPKASAILGRVAYDSDPDKALGSYWEPGRFVVQNLLRDIKPPTDSFRDIERIEYEPNAAHGSPKAGKGDSAIAVTKQMTVAQSMDHVRTFSSFHNWHEAHPDAKSRKQGGNGDLVDEMYDEMKETEGWADDDMMLEVEWGTALILARKA